MYDKIEMMRLIKNKQKLESEYNSLTCGAIEIRKRNGIEYIYVHKREENKHKTKYVGEYIDKLYNLIISNNIKAKEIKKQIRLITKQLDAINYLEKQLSPSTEKNIDLVKKYLAKIIWKQIELEDIDINYTNVKNILNNGKINSTRPDDILKVMNLKNAWDFVIDKDIVTEDSNVELLCQINKLIAEGIYYTAGVIRSLPIDKEIKSKKNVPSIKEIETDLNNIEDKKISDVEKAIELMLYIIKKQIFIDENENTALIFANHYLISKGKGILFPNNTKELKELLNDFCNGKSIIKLKLFLKEECLISV